MDHLLAVENLTVSFDEEQILHNISFCLNDADVLAIIGPNGAGKSVLFRALLGLVPYTGTINWRKGIKISYMPQKMSIEKDFPLSVREFLEMKKGNIDEALSLTGLDQSILDKKLANMSGGQFQRLLIAWAIVDKPNVILFDEPLAGIDVGGEETIYNLLEKLNKTQGTTILLISHDLGMVYKYANNVLCINKEMVCLGHPSEVINEENTTKLYGSLVTHHDHNHKHNHEHD